MPAILIYEIFPDTKVGAKGLLGTLKINALIISTNHSYVLWEKRKSNIM